MAKAAKNTGKHPDDEPTITVHVNGKPVHIAQAEVVPAHATETYEEACLRVAKTKAIPK